MSMDDNGSCQSCPARCIEACALPRLPHATNARTEQIDLLLARIDTAWMWTWTSVASWVNFTTQAEDCWLALHEPWLWLHIGDSV